MKLLVLAHTPPPLHGQSVMVRALVDGLARPGLAVHHVNLQLSADAADIGRWRAGKILATLAAACRAIRARFVHGCDTLYYVPAPPAKRGALYRDWTLMLLCRPFFRRLVLHWHAAGLGEWLRRDAYAFERTVTQRLLGRADLAIVLANALRDDAAELHARRVAVVPNGLPDPGNPPPIAAAPPCRLFFLGLCSEAKGLFAAVAAVLAANRRRGADGSPAFVLTAAGPFEREQDRARFASLAAENPGVLRHAGVVGDVEKFRLFAAAHALIFPTRYAAEGMPLVVLEALAHDRPVIATRWRALPEMITAATGELVPPADDAALVAALERVRERPATPGVCRRHFLAHFTLERHLAALAAALTELDATKR